MAKDKVEMLAKVYEHAFEETIKAAEKVTPDKQFRQAQPGKAHPLWLLGHLTFSLDTIVNLMCLGGAQQLPPTYMAKFSPAVMGGPAITTNASDYPAWSEVLGNYKKVSQSTSELLRKLDDADLPGGAKGNVPPPFADFFKVLGNTLGHMADHDAYHRGQLGLLVALA